MRKQSSLFGGAAGGTEKQNRIEKEKITYEVGTDATPKPLSVSEFLALVNAALREIEAQITGEITKTSFPPSGHVYFSLKDEKDESVIDCVIWRSQYEATGVRLEAGMRIVALGCADVYPPTGRFAFKARAIELTGEGVLKKRYEELKRRLAAEGVFDEARKRRIPDYPQRIGVITSRNGAVIHDILNNLGRFGYQVLLADARVEGPEAVGSLRAAIAAMRKIAENGIRDGGAGLDALIIARGGGSMEALQAFDNEMLIRDILAFPVPVIAGIGHHQDVPLAALAADAHASTPTAVANLLNRSWAEASFRLAHESERIFAIYRNIVAGAESALEYEPYLRSIGRMCAGVRGGIADLEVASFRIAKYLLARAKAELDVAERVIAANDPARNLRLGYSIARRNGKILKSVNGLAAGDGFDLQFQDGTIEGKVQGKFHENNFG